MKKCIFGLAKDDVHARNIVTDLQNQGFDAEYISFMAFDKDNRFTKKNANGEFETNPEFFNERPVENKNFDGGIGHEKNTKAPEGAATGATAGGIIGGSLGLLAGLGALAIPGIGPFVAAGPIMALLAGSAVGGSLGLIVGALVGLGLPEYEAKNYEKGIRDGHVLISVEAFDADHVDRAKAILEQDGAKDIATVGEAVSSR